MANASAVETNIIDLTHDGQGVADVDGKRLFVAGALPGERVEIAPRRARRRMQEADLVRILEPSNDRVQPACEYFGRCGGCALQHLDYAAQVAFKQRTVAQTLVRIGNVTPDSWLEPITGPQWHYRRRARLGVKFVEAKERVLVGFRERSASCVTDMAHCRVLVQPMDSLLGELALEIAASSIRKRLPQIEFAAGGCASANGGAESKRLPQIKFAAGDVIDSRAQGAAGDVLDSRAQSVEATSEADTAPCVPALVFRVLDAPNDEDRVRFGQFAERHGVDIYLQPGGPGTVVPLNPRTVRRLEYRLDRFNVTLGFAPTDFIQINARVNEQMVEAAIDLAELRPTDRVLDLYCGLGNFSLPLARSAAEVLGVEGEAGLVARAAANAADNSIDNARFATANLAESDWGFYREPWDVVMLDPPRTGAAAPVAELARLRPRRIVYVSCHPATLARDAKALASAGYRLRVARILDMFPHTHHVEAMAVFERR